MPSEHTDRQKPEKPDKHAIPAVQKSDCPNCGRKGVVVFSVVRPDQPDDTARLVCLRCCPKTSGDSASEESS